LGVRWLWPFVVLGLGALYLWAGIRSHCLNGLPQFFPLLAFLGLVFLAFGTSWWLLLSAAEWSMLEAAVSLATLVIAAVPAMIGYAAYGELWRRFYNRSVEAVVLKALPGGKKRPPQVVTQIFEAARPQSEFRKITEEQSRRKEWGSRHCLGICKKALADRKRGVLGDPIHGVPTDNYDLCLDTGDDLFYYYLLRWPEEVEVPGGLRATILYPLQQLVDLLFPSPGEVVVPTWVQASVLDLLRQLVTIWLQGTEEQRGPHHTPAARWVSELGKSSDPYYRFLSECFELGRGVRGVSVPARIETALSHYRQMRDDNQSRGRQPAERLICQNTWLALAHRSIRAQPCYDVWMAMRRIEEEGPDLPPPKGSDPDAALLMARAFLAAHLDNWARETHQDWRQGLEGAARIIQKE
jgi:hypothetical protein